MSEIKDGSYGFVSGTVSRVFTTKNGPAAEIEVKPLNRDGTVPQYGDKWVAWGLNLTEGDRVSVKGWLSVRAETFTNQQGEVKAACRRNINNGEVTAREGAANATATPQTGQSDTWATPGPQASAGSFGDDTPF